MLARLANLAIAAPRRIVIFAMFAAVAAAVFGVPVAGKLSAGGFGDPSSESSQAQALLADHFNQGDTQLLITVTAPQGVTSEAARTVGTDIVDTLSHSPNVASVTSAWTVKDPACLLYTSDAADE